MTINTPMLWVVFPMFVSATLAILYRRRLLSTILTSITGFGLGALAAFFPEELFIAFGPLQLTFVESLTILGRQLSITYQILPFIAFIYIATGLWGLGSVLPSVPDNFRPISLVVTALLTAALSVEPFLYAALFIQAAILFSIPMLSPLEMKTDPGILRYLSLETLAMPLILLAGWLLSGVETLPPDSPLIVQSMIILGLGIGLWLAVFPFHSWVPMVSEKSHPMALSFVLFIFPTIIALFSLNFFDRYTFLRTFETLYQALLIIGALMVVLGGLWTAYQENIKRAFGYSFMVETGFILLAIGLSNQAGLHWLLLLFPIHAMGFWLWGFALSLILKKADSQFVKQLKGFARRYPIISTGLIIAQLSIAGLPLLGTFPIKIAMLSEVFTNGVALGLWIFVGNIGLFVFSIRLLVSLVQPDEQQRGNAWTVLEKRQVYIPLILMILLIILTGLFPNGIQSNITKILTTFTHLQ